MPVALETLDLGCLGCLAKGPRRAPRPPAEGAREGLMAVEAHSQGDLDDLRVGHRQPVSRALQPQPFDMAAWGLADGAGKLAVELEGGDADGLGQDPQCEILVEVVLHLGQQRRDLG